MADERLHIKITADTGAFTRAMAKAQLAMKAMQKNVDRDMVNIRNTFRSASLDISKSMSGMKDNISKSMGAVGGIIKAGLVASLSSAVPVIAVATAGVMALGSALASAGLGLGALAAVAIPVGKKIGEVSDEIQKQKDILDDWGASDKAKATAQERLNQIMAETPPEILKASEAMTKLKDTYQATAEKFTVPIAKMMTSGLGIAIDLLGRMEPIIKAVIPAVQGLLDKFSQKLNTGGFDDFFNWVRDTAPKAIENLSLVFGNTFTGIMNLFRAFTPLSDDVQGGLLGMTERFAEWSEGLSKSEGFQKFVDYVKVNTPIVLGFIGNMTMTFINLGKELAPLGSKVLSALNKAFKFLSENMDKVVPIAGALLGAFVGFKAITAVVGIIGAAKNAFTLLVGGLKLAKTAFLALKVAMLTNPFTAIAIAVLAVATLIYLNWDKIKVYLEKAWSWIKDVAVKIWDGLKAYFNFVLEFWKKIFSGAWDRITSIIVTAWVGIKKWVSEGMAKVGEYISQGMTWARDTVLKLWTSIKGQFIMKIREIQAKVLSFKYALIAKFNELKDSVINKVLTLWTSVKNNFVMSFLYIRARVLTFVYAVIAKFNELKNKAIEKIQALKSGIQTKFLEAVTYLKSKVIDLRDSMVNKFNELKNKAVEKFTTLKSDLKKKFEETVTDLVDKAKALPGKIGSAISNAAKDAVQGVKDLGTKIIDTFKEKLGIKSPSRVFTTLGEHVINGLKNGLTADNIFKFGTKLFGGLAESAKGAVDYIKGAFSGNLGGGVQKWAGLATQALMMTGQYSENNLQKLLYQMKTESGGNARAINLWDINAQRGIPSKGLMQVIDPTFRAYAMPGYDKDVYDPLSNMLASIRYATSRYGTLDNAYRGVGYATGGIFNGSKDGVMAKIAEGHGNEAVVPLSNKTRMKPFAHAVAKMMPQEGRSNNEPIQLEITVNSPVSIDGKEIARAVAEPIQLELNRRELRANRRSGN